jgi:hypothetical protein
MDRGTTIGIGETGTVAVALDNSIPSGPWTAEMVLTSGSTTRTATAKITFPSAPATSSGPVAASAAGGGADWRPPMVTAAAVTVAGATAGSILLGRRRRRRRYETVPQPA